VRAKPSSYVSAATAEVTILSANENNYGREIPRAQTSAPNSGVRESIGAWPNRGASFSIR
jgi:hypothetical protein